MWKFLVKKNPADAGSQAIQEAVTSAGQELLEARGKRKRSKPPHASQAWPLEKKNKVVDEYLKSNYKQMQLNLGAACPPRSTLDGWAWRRRHGTVLAAAGRPTALSGPEEEYVLYAVKYLPSKGAPVDREIVICMARKCVAACRNLTPAQVPELSEHWCRSFRKRHHRPRDHPSGARPG